MLLVVDSQQTLVQRFLRLLVVVGQDVQFQLGDEHLVLLLLLGALLPLFLWLLLSVFRSGLFVLSQVASFSVADSSVWAWVYYLLLDLLAGLSFLVFLVLCVAYFLFVSVLPILFILLGLFRLFILFQLLVYPIFPIVPVYPIFSIL